MRKVDTRFVEPFSPQLEVDPQIKKLHVRLDGIQAEVGNLRRTVLLVLVVVSVLLGMHLFQSDTAQAAPVKARKVTISYNSSLSLHQAAMPARYKVGSKYKITYRSKSVIVRAIYGGCSCLDVSDEAFRRLAGSTSKGIIRATVSER